MYPKPIKVASFKNIKQSWKDSRDATGKGGAPGIDGIRPTKYKENLETNIVKLREKLLDGNYVYKKLKPHFIQKTDGKDRVICVPAVEDRLVQRIILRNLCADGRDRLGVLSPVSYGVKKGKDQGVHAAIRAALKLRKQYNWVLKTDVSKFFDNIPREYLKNKVRARLGKSSVVPLIEAAIECEVYAENTKDRERIKLSGIENGLGLRQGMPLSPLLSNLVLNRFDNRSMSKDLNLVRYADDIIVFCSNKKECFDALVFIESELEKLKLSVPSIDVGSSKTEIVAPDEPVIFLGVEIYRLNNGKYAKRIPDGTKLRARQKIKDHANLEWNIAEGYDYAKVVQRLKDIPDGYSAAFAECTNLETFRQVLEEDSSLVKQSLLEQIFGKDIFDSLSENQKEFMGFL